MGDRDDRIFEALVRLETKMDTANGRLDDHGKRLRALEQFRNYAAGAAGVLAGLWAMVKVNIKTN